MFDIGDEIEFPYMATYYRGMISKIIGDNYVVFCFKNFTKYVVHKQEARKVK